MLNLEAQALLGKPLQQRQALTLYSFCLLLCTRLDFQVESLVSASTADCTTVKGTAHLSAV